MVLVILDNYISSSLMAAALEEKLHEEEETQIAVLTMGEVADQVFHLCCSLAKRDSQRPITGGIGIDQYKSIGLGSKPTLKSLLRHRHLRRTDLAHLQSALSACGIPTSGIAEVWFGSNPLLPLLQELFPDAKFIKFEHGISDTLSSLDPSRPSLLRLLFSKVESRVLGFSTLTRPTSIGVSLIPGRGRLNVSPEQIQTVHVRLAHLFIQDGLLDSLVPEGFEERVVLVLPPLIPLPFAETLTDRFASRLWASLAGLEPSKRFRLLVKQHPDQMSTLAPNGLELLIGSITSCAPPETRFEIEVIDPSVPAELLLAQGSVTALRGVLSTTHLNARVLFRSVDVAEIDWSMEYNESCSRAARQLTASKSSSVGRSPTAGDVTDHIAYLKLIASASKWSGPKLEQLFAMYPEFSWVREEL